MMKQKLFCLGDDFMIKDENGSDAFFVDGKAFSLGKKLSFQDLEKNELAFIRQKLISLAPTYEIYRNDALVATVKKQLFSFIRYKFNVDVPGTGDFEATGNFLDRDYVFTRDGTQIAQISKRWFTIADTYGVDIAEGEDDVLILACTVVIDMVCHASEDHH